MPVPSTSKEHHAFTSSRLVHLENVIPLYMNGNMQSLPESVRQIDVLVVVVIVVVIVVVAVVVVVAVMNGAYVVVIIK